MDSSWKHRSRDPEAAVNIFRLLTTVVQGKETPAFFYPDSGGGETKQSQRRFEKPDVGHSGK